jgi:hypothetical protein
MVRRSIPDSLNLENMRLIISDSIHLSKKQPKKQWDEKGFYYRGDCANMGDWRLKVSLYIYLRLRILG